MDKDLASIQEARDLAMAAHTAWQSWSKASQEQVDRVCAAMAEAGYAASERLGRLAQEETGYGVALHKKLKNEFGSRNVWESIRDVRTVGVIRHDPARRVYEIAWPMGIVVALVPSTNPTSTAFLQSPDRGQGPQCHCGRACIRPRPAAPMKPSRPWRWQPKLPARRGDWSLACSRSACRVHRN